ncbi:mitogen-activated protein kinase kinase kinase 13 isoform X1 [Euwallacea similis]|uniref:mitogen-activated protein kinase kinase kinase 13 isoform X1 n=2 Tax=Euwallacea similis TaxID=1736056 RepID=UPI00344F2D37
MHTPESTLERGVVPPNAVPVTLDMDLDEVIVGKDECDDVTAQRLEDELSSLHILADANVVNMPPVVQDSSPDTPQPHVYDLKQGWMTGIFGCLRPMLNIIGKGVQDSKNTQDDWEIPFEKISDLQFISSGAQGTVFSGYLYNTLVAIKKVAELKDTDIVNLRKLNHPNIVKFKGVCTQEPCYCIVMEFCPYGSMFNLLKNQKNVVTINRVVSWSKQIASGMHYLHMHKIIHRDLKSPNVLIGDEEIIKISDFGTSRTWNGVSEKMTFAGTVAWMAPEALQELACSEKVDIWSFGVVLWELLTCEVPYDGMEQNAIMYSVGSGKLKPPIPSSCPDGFKLILQMCWKQNPKERPSFKLISNHLEIASVEILAKFKDEQFFKTQDAWKAEIKSQITQFVEQLQKHKIEYHLKEEQLIKKREMEIKHILDIKELYDRKLEQVHQLCAELTGMMQRERAKSAGVLQLERKSDRRRRFLNWKKVDRRNRCNNAGNQSTTPTSPECSLTSPEAVENAESDPKASLFITLNPATEIITTQTSTGSYRKRHHRTGSASPRSSGFGSRASSCRASLVVNAETQTDSVDFSEEADLNSPGTEGFGYSFPLAAQRVILQQFGSGTEDGAAQNGNTVQLHYMMQHSSTHVPFFAFGRDPKEDTVNRNIDTPEVSGEENLEAITRKVSAITVFDNGNVGDNLVLSRQRARDRDSTEDAANEDSFTDEEGEIYDPSLRRRSKLSAKDMASVKQSLARRPICPGRRLKRYNVYHQRFDQRELASDEGNTSEYSVSPSSKSSTLDSNHGGLRSSPIVPRVHAKRASSYTSDSDSEENTMTTVVTQVPSFGG